MVTIGQELILTENTRLAEAASWRQFGGPAPHQPCDSRSVSPWSLLTQAAGCGVKAELWTESRED